MHCMQRAKGLLTGRTKKTHRICLKIIDFRISPLRVHFAVEIYRTLNRNQESFSATGLESDRDMNVGVYNLNRDRVTYSERPELVLIEIYGRVDSKYINYNLIRLY